MHIENVCKTIALCRVNFSCAKTNNCNQWLFDKPLSRSNYIGSSCTDKWLQNKWSTRNYKKSENTSIDRIMELQSVLGLKFCFHSRLGLVYKCLSFNVCYEQWPLPKDNPLKERAI